jgi:ABC-type Fe3+-siderophore transport system permease subunit
MLNKIVLWVVLIAPWFTLFFLKKEEIKRYMPAAIFASFLMIIYNIFAYNQAHWEIKVSIIPWLDPLFVPGIFGAFPVITLLLYLRKVWRLSVNKYCY